MPHSPLSPVCAAASAQLCTAINNFAVQEHNVYGGEFPRDLFPVAPTVDGGRLVLPDTPGLGVDFNEDAAPNQQPPWDAFPTPDIEISGNIENILGLVSIASQGSVIVRANINAGTLQISAGRDFVLTAPESLFHVGGDPGGGTVPFDHVIGRVVTIWWPLGRAEGVGRVDPRGSASAVAGTP